VFSDVVLPGISGLDMARIIRARYPGLPVVLTSGYRDVIARDGDDDFELVPKPYSMDTISRVLRRATAET
jgi:FixJ family two-component response regulator